MKILHRWFAPILSGLCLSIGFPAAPAGAAEPVPVKEADAKPLAGTQRLTMKGDIASHLVAAVDKFLLTEIDKSVERRANFWKRDTSSPEAYVKSILPIRNRLAHILGVRDKRLA